MMSRQAHLPPRCPFQKKMIPHPVHSSISSTLHEDFELYPQHHKSPSQSSISEERPAWLDDLLNDTDVSSKAIIHRRSVSDPLTVLDGNEQITSVSSISIEKEAPSVGTDSNLEWACTYGPNSPRQRVSHTFSESAVASALSNYISQNSILNVDTSDLIVGHCSNWKQDSCGSVGELNVETRAVKRHPGQRSRVRKLHYISELERKVNVLQALEADLAARVVSLHQRHVFLSIENGKLKKQLARFQLEKLLVDGQHESLLKEVERLKNGLAGMKILSGSAYEAGRVADVNWQMLDLGKLNFY